MLGGGFQSFVAWRYLMARYHTASRPIAAIALGCVVAAAVTYGLHAGLLWHFEQEHPRLPAFNRYVPSMSGLHKVDDLGVWAMRGIGLLLGGGALALALRARRGVVSLIAWAGFVGGLLVLALGVAMHWLVGDRSFVELALLIAPILLVPIPLLLVLGLFRAAFSFFTTVSVSGVFVGSMALVVVLSIMGGFETDLRDKILGSNAHIRITRDEGGIEDWPDVMARLAKVPGVVGVTPYMTSEVVLSANNNYATVIIKGIDPASVGAVTDLVSDLDDPGGMQRLQPLAEDPIDPEVEEPDSGDGQGGDAGVIDPAPEDMPGGGEPIDYSGDEAPVDFGAPDVGDGGDPNDDVVDRAPDDFAGDTDDEEPIDFSGGDGDGDGDGGTGTGTGTGTGRGRVDTTIGKVGRMALDRGPDPLSLPPRDGGRLALLDGVLVGKELEKQLHLYRGQEIRLVSPLADPANPDATGTPIPYHRDYRIAGTFFTGMYEYDLKFVYVTIDSLQEFLQTGDVVDGIEIRISDPEDTGAVGARLARELGPGYTVQDWKELNRNLFSALKLEKIAMFLVLGIVILVASFSIIGNLIMVVVEKSREIALLKTLGASDEGVMMLFVMQGFFIGAVGTLSGVLVGLGICGALATWGFPIPAEVYYIDSLPIHVDPVSVILVAAAGLGVSVVATIYPALVAARMRPAIGLRHD